MNNARLLTHLFRFLFLVCLAAGVEAHAQMRDPSRDGDGRAVVRSDSRASGITPVPSPNDAIYLPRKNASYYLDIARVYASAKPPDYNEAELNYRRAIAVNAKGERAYEGLGAIFLVQRRYADAVAAFEQAVRLSPRRAEAQFGLGAAYYGAGNHEASAARVGILRALKKEKAAKLADNLAALIAR